MKIFREPLLQFLFLGALIFLLYNRIGKPSGKSPEQIVVSAARIEGLSEGWRRTWRRPPTQQELEGLIQDAIEEEVLYREALALGLDQDDTIIRRRLRQKMEFLSEDLSAQAQPSEPELRDFLQQRADLFRVEPRISFRHVYLNPDRPGGSRAEAERLLKKLNDPGEKHQEVADGDPLPLPSVYEQLPEGEVEKLFGPDFAQGLLKLEPGAWRGPIESGFGFHLVQVQERSLGRTPELAEVSDAVKREWQAVQREKFHNQLMKGLAEKYSIQVERPEPAGTPEKTEAK